MTPTDSPQDHAAQLKPEERVSALFANFIIQQTNTALILLGRVPNPETGERMQDLEAAKLFIDTLEMLEAKTKGNLDKREEQMLKQSLTTLRMAFVEAVETPAPEAGAPAKSTSPPASSAPPGGEHPSAPAVEPGKSGEDSHKKFSKKY